MANQANSLSHTKWIFFLPPYSPELNPIEHFWAFLKQKLKNVCIISLTLMTFYITVSIAIDYRYGK